MRVVYVDDINREIKENCKDFIARADNEYLQEISGVAKKIIEERDEKPIVLISGPSGSAKTTTAVMLGKAMTAMGYENHTIAMDRYFLSLTEEEKRLVKEGNIDLETPLRLNADLLTEQLDGLINYRPIRLPDFDFVNSRSIDSGKTIQRNPGAIVIMEGIHALNPDVIKLPDGKTSKIYVSVRTRISNGKEMLHPSKIRLMRRMVRDIQERGRPYAETAMIYDDVQYGEENYILPYKKRADFNIDTFKDYEASAYMSVLKDELPKIKGYQEIDDIRNILADLTILPGDLIPENSMIREFLGKKI